MTARMTQRLLIGNDKATKERRIAGLLPLTPKGEPELGSAGVIATVSSVPFSGILESGESVIQTI